MDASKKAAQLAGLRVRVPGHQPQGVEQERAEVPKDRRWPGTLMAIGVFMALVSTLTVVPWTLVEPAFLLRFFIGLCFVGNLLPYARSGLRMGMERLEWFLFNLLAIGPLVTTTLLWVNYLFHGPVTSGIHAVLHVEDHGTYLTYEFNDGYLDRHWMARSNYRDWPSAHGRLLRVSTAQGLLGIEVVVRKERAE